MFSFRGIHRSRIPASVIDMNPALGILQGHKNLYAYASSLADGLNVFDPCYHIPPNIEQFLYSSSMTVIAFLSLVFSTPKIPILRKAAFISIGVIVFVLSDSFLIQHMKGNSL